MVVKEHVTYIFRKTMASSKRRTRAAPMPTPIQMPVPLLWFRSDDKLSNPLPDRGGIGLPSSAQSSTIEQIRRITTKSPTYQYTEGRVRPIWHPRRTFCWKIRVAGSPERSDIPQRFRTLCSSWPGRRVRSPLLPADCSPPLNQIELNEWTRSSGEQFVTFAKRLLAVPQSGDETFARQWTDDPAAFRAGVRGHASYRQWTDWCWHAAGRVVGHLTDARDFWWKDKILKLKNWIPSFGFIQFHLFLHRWIALEILYWKSFRSKLIGLKVRPQNPENCAWNDSRTSFTRNCGQTRDRIALVSKDFK